MTSGVARLGLLLAALSALGCQPYDRPNRPVPPSFEAHLLGGQRVDATFLKGQPWVINLWVPG
jgi:hypothetical protein